MELIPSIFIFAFSAGITPGPNNIMLMTSGLNFGIQKSMPHYFGINFGFPIMFTLIGLSLGIIFNRYPVMHEIIKVIGLAYLLYLAWRIANTSTSSLSVKESKPLSLVQALLFQWVNPKAWVMATGAIAAFTTTDGNIYLQVGLITLVFLFTSFLTSSSWLFFGAWLKKILKDPFHQKVFNISMAVLLVLSFSPVAFDLINQYLIN
ncbi:MAG: lysine transporter LysE [Gammaproteobacteria bacterium]|nr:lysine transporter LysE [Gammaproteobacteria bacterium]MAY01867.1 lysine transporter LysE [Gammaproteobacteria bacterium]|tara:strand:- start:1947 stop:2564 length:618 start_codon:yes stop_codon:yes gene_type:complete